MVKNHLPVQEMEKSWVRSLDQEDPQEEGMATYSSILSWRIPIGGGAWWATVHWVTKSWATEPTQHAFMHTAHFMCFLAICMPSLKISVQIPVFEKVAYFFDVELYEFFVY